MPKGQNKERTMNVLTAIYEYSAETLTVKLNGEIDHHSAKEARSEIDRQILFHRPKELILNLERVGFMELKRKIDTLNREYGSQGKGS